MRRTTAAALLAVPLLLTACAAGDDAGSVTAEESVASDDAAAPAAGMDREMDMSSDDMADEEAGEGASDGGDLERAVDEAVGDVATASATAGRQLARTARLTLQVDDVDEAAARVQATATRLGGFVAEAQVRGGEDGFGVLTLRVPATSLDTAVEELREVGVAVVDTSVTTEDLTDQLTDSAARLRNLEALEEQLLALLADVREGDPSAGELLTVFERVNGVRGEIERIEASRAGLQDRVALATVTVELETVPPTLAAADEAEPNAFDEAWAATRDAFGGIAELGIWLVVTVLPVSLALLAVPALAYTAWRRRGEGPATPAPPAGPHAPEA